MTDHDEGKFRETFLRLVCAPRPQFRERVLTAVGAVRPRKPRPRLGRIGGLAMVGSLVLAAIVLGGLLPQSHPGVRPAAGKALFVLITVRGEVRDGAGRALKVGDQLAAGASVRTGKQGRVVMVTRGGSGFVLDARTELGLARDGKTATLRGGRLYCRNTKHEFAAVTTAAGQIRLLGTVIDATVKRRDQVAVTVVEGKVKLANAHGTALVPAGRKALLIASAAPSSGSAADVLAETAWVEGTLYYRAAEKFGPGWSGGEVVFQALTGSLQTEQAMPSSDAQVSPVNRDIVWSDGLTPELHPTQQSILVQKEDGPNVNLTELAGIGGLNCKPKWSPDGTMIAFQHCDASGQRPACQEGFHVWIMNADGSNAHSLTAADAPSTKGPVWTPDGRHLLVQVENSGSMYLADLTGGPLQQLPGVMEDPVWSPNGNWMAFTSEVRGTQDERPGVWRQLLLADTLGNNPRVLVKQFIADADIAPYYPTAEQQEKNPEHDWIEDLCYWVGPTLPQWSPDGAQIAFLAALPFEAAGPYYREQVRVWIYDLNAEKLVQVTYGNLGVYALVWSRYRDGAVAGVAAPSPPS